MNYIDEIACAIYQLADPGMTYPAEPAMDLYRIYAVLASTKGETVTAKDVHDAWSAHMAKIWPGHRSIVPFDQLSRGVQRLDDHYVEAIRTVARQMNT